MINIRLVCFLFCKDIFLRSEWDSLGKRELVHEFELQGQNEADIDLNERTERVKQNLLSASSSSISSGYNVKGSCSCS